MHYYSSLEFLSENFVHLYLRIEVKGEGETAPNVGVGEKGEVGEHHGFRVYRHPGAVPFTTLK